MRGDVREGFADLGEVRLHYVEAGSPEGRLVLLLHGFPEFWYSWRFQLPALAEAGFHVVAPDLRGYNLSSKPTGVFAYRLPALIGDVAGLVRFFVARRASGGGGAERACVVGHDWGALVAWFFAMQEPGLLDRLSILNVPHPVRAAQGMLTPRQLRRSWYLFFLQLPWLPEASARAGRSAVLRRLLERDPVRPGAFTPEDIERYVAALAQPGAARASIHYYRALFRTPWWRLLRPILAPVQILWGEQDRYLGRELAEPSRDWVPHFALDRLPNASHWLQSDQPEAVNALLRRFLQW